MARWFIENLRLTNIETPKSSLNKDDCLSIIKNMQGPQGCLSPFGYIRYSEASDQKDTFDTTLSIFSMTDVVHVNIKGKQVIHGTDLTVTIEMGMYSALFQASILFTLLICSVFYIEFLPLALLFVGIAWVSFPLSATLVKNRITMMLYKKLKCK